MIKSTNELTPQELITIFQARTAVFVVEQDCPYQEVDEADREALHVCLEEASKLAAYARILVEPDGIHFGRVLVMKEFRGQQLGKKLVSETLAEIERRYPNRPIIISAQAHLTKFYGAFGFVTISAVYLEDDIPHVDMRLQK
ncbi:GNAT family N-acetyltransferase [Enterococcus hermanniensis]|uniref:N-acetyltransferase domain-containing protein n=1 Tax=Enterococcus hermanniensis TaxID=249189 RepID=A0A1L8TNM4_9ENTE|nr:GNAT family N-acetyltransferase [Enterococcus hermanniensis]OJG45860.1 hypothetical protein RV04_GL001626 [Enterococcus hermanniensis]